MKLIRIALIALVLFAATPAQAAELPAGCQVYADGSQKCGKVLA
jgi:hypothetical protein